MYKIKSTTVVLLLLMVMFGCSSGTVPGDDEDDGGSGGGAMSCGGCPCVGDLNVSKPQSVGNSNICSIGGTLTKNATLPALAADKWHIVDSIIIDSGILTVQPGVEVFAESDEYIYVMPGASLRAIGTSAQPITFSSIDADFDLDTGAGSNDGWIGLIVDTQTSSSANYLEFVIVSEAGGEASAAGPSLAGHHAGISLFGRQENTVLNNVQVHDTLGDGVHIDGLGNGAIPKLDSILVTGAGRDGIYYEDFSGLIKDALIVHRSGVYSSNLNGRAGIRAGGINSNPLITNITLVGRDATSTNDLGDEYGFLVESNASEIRIANTLILNFRNGCYGISDGADLSSVAETGGPLDGFVGGVHCVDETSGAADIGDALPAGNDFSVSAIGSGNGEGLRFYDGFAANFEADVNTSAGFSAGWLLNDINGLLNDGTANTCAADSATYLCLYNDGVTDPDQFLGQVDGLTEPGTIYFYVGPVPIQDWNPVDGVTFEDYVFIDPTTRLPLDPQPAATSNFVNGYIAEIVSNGAFDLKQVGAIKSSNLNTFDGWTLQGRSSPAVTGFDP